MTKRNADNERVKRRYLVYLKDAKGRDVASVDAAASAIERFEGYVKSRDFKGFHIEQARGFKAHLLAATNARTGLRLSASTVHATLAAVKAFFVWLADQRGYASRIKYADTEYFNAPDNLSRIATARRFKSCPTLAQVRAMIHSMPEETEVQKRDRAIIAFTILSGARDRATISFRLKHIDIDNEMVEQDAREVRTKRAKTFMTRFFPLGDDFRKIVVDWVTFFGRKSALDPTTRCSQKLRSRPATMASTGPYLYRRAWANANPVRDIFREACARAELPYFNPHLLRNTLVQVAYDRKLDAGSLQGLVAEPRA